MKRTTRTIIFVVVGLMVMATMTAATAGSAKDRPFDERLVGGATGMVEQGDDDYDAMVEELGCTGSPAWVSSSAGTGHVTHMGRVQWTTSHCFYFNESGPPTFGFADVEITAANGDKVFATYDGFMTTGTTFAETMTILGGTGRFEGATGTVDEVGWLDFTTGYMEVTGDGWIIFDASHRGKKK